MKIALFDLAGYDYPGGCEKYFYNLAQYLSIDHSVTFYGSIQYKRFMDYVYRILFGRKLDAVMYLSRDLGKMYPFYITFSVLFPFLSSYQALKKSLLQQDIIYAKNEFQELGVLYYILGRNEYKKRVIVGMHTPVFIPLTLHGIWERIHVIQYGSFLYRCFIFHARKIHVLNSDYEMLVADTYHIPQEQIVCIPNPIEWDTSLTNNTSEFFTMVWVGRLTMQKGLDRLEKIIDMLSQKSWFKDIRIVIAGDGEKRDLIEDWNKKYSPVIVYKGFVQDMVGLYQRADLSLFTAYFDTFAHAVLESQSYGLPVISYAIPGPNDIIEHGKTGYLVNSEEEFVVAIEKLYLLKKKHAKFVAFRRDIFDSVNKRFSRKHIFMELEHMILE